MSSIRDTLLTPEHSILETEWNLYFMRYRMAGCIAKTPALRNLCTAAPAARSRRSQRCRRHARCARVIDREVGAGQAQGRSVWCGCDPRP